MSADQPNAGPYRYRYVGEAEAFVHVTDGVAFDLLPGGEYDSPLPLLGNPLYVPLNRPAKQAAKDAETAANGPQAAASSGNAEPPAPVADSGGAPPTA